MNAPFNQLSLVQRLEREGIARGAAEAIAGGIEEACKSPTPRPVIRSEGSRHRRAPNTWTTRSGVDSERSGPLSAQIERSTDDVVFMKTVIWFCYLTMMTVFLGALIELKLK